MGVEILGPGESRWSGTSGERRLSVRVSGADTGGAFALLEALRRAEREDRPLHAHANEDEILYVLEGRLVLRTADRTVELEEGGVAIIPRGEFHSHRSLGNGVNRYLTIFSPAGVDEYVRERDEAVARGETDLAKRLDVKYGVLSESAPGR